jgi:addiction module HigA family antidote
MIPKNRIPTHPGEILLEDFLRPMEITQKQLAEHIGDHAPKINDIINGRRGVSPAMAWKLPRALNTTPEFWTNLQAAFDLAKAREEAPAIKPLRRAG